MRFRYSVFTVVIIGILVGFGCSKIIPPLAPKKQGQLAAAADARAADRYFWEQFHRGNYDSIPRVLDRLMAAYLDNNRDYRLAAHIGFAHAWALGESERQSDPPPRVTDHATLAVKYFDEAYRLNPEKDWRYYGFLVSMQMAEGGIHGDMQEMTAGYFRMKRAVRKYPKFNLFTAAYTLAMSPRPQDREAAVEMLWDNIERCVGERVDRERLDYRAYLDRAEVEGPNSTCWNTWIAPHNMEGFLLILGDMLLRRGEYTLAGQVYRNATYFPEYENWAYRPQLEARLIYADRLLDGAIAYDAAGVIAVDRCMVCHQDGRLTTPPDVHLSVPQSHPRPFLRTATR